MTTTPTLGLTQYATSDKINWVNEYNKDMLNIDTAVNAVTANMQSQIDVLDDTKANQTSLDATNAIVALKADKSEVTNVMTPKGNLSYASLPATGNTVGWYYYCPDGDGTHGAGNYVWSGTSWYFGGTGDEGYNMLKGDLIKLDDYNLMSSEIHFNEWYQINGQGSQTYNGWCWFKVDNPNRGKVGNYKYGVYQYTNGEFSEQTVYYYWEFADSQYNGGANAKLSATPFSQNMESLYISIPMSTLKNGIVVCDINNISKMTVNYPTKSLVNASGVVVDLDKCHIVNITNPYLYIDEHSNITIVFDNMIYEYNGLLVNYSKTDLKSDLTTNWPYDYVFKYDVQRFALTNNQKLIFSPSKHKMFIANSVESDSDIVMVYVENDLLRGVFKDFYNRNINDSKNRSLWNELSNEMIASIDEKEDSIISECGEDKFVFGYLSDDHSTGWLNRYRKYTAMALDRVSKSIMVDTILNCGDSVLSSGGALNALRKQFDKTDKKDVLFVQGNHDRNIDSPILSQTDFFNFMYRGLTKESSIHFGNPPATYFYKDFADKKIRIIVLDLYDIPSQYNYNDHNGYRENQLKWLCETALVIESDWSVIVATHSSPYSDTDGMTNNTGGQANREMLPKILKAFKNGTSVALASSGILDTVFDVNFTVDFTSQGARELIGVFTGHNHTDVILNKEGINYISITCGYIDVQLYRGQLGWRYQDTYSAIGFDIAIVDTTTKKVKLKRFGWGSDREFNY